MKVKDLMDQGFEDFDIEFVESKIVEEHMFPDVTRSKLEIVDIGHSSKVIVLGKKEV
jgi:hypothetical protein